MVDSETASLVSIQIQDRNGLTETISIPERLEKFKDADFLSNQPYKKVLRVFKNDKKLAARITTYHPNGQIWQYLESQDMRAFGTYKEWHSNGLLKVEARVIGGTADVVAGAQRDWLFDGTAFVWDDQGNMLASFPYQKGQLDGKLLNYFSNGLIQKESVYHQNELEGESKEYTSEGKLCSKTNYVKGKKHGNSIGFWWENQTSWSEEYQEGLLLQGKYYAKDGTLISEVESGAGFQSIFNDQKLDKLIQYKMGRPEGIIKTYRSSGELKSYYHIKNGIRNGEEVEYYPAYEREDENLQKTPLPKILIAWENGAISGLVKTWYPDGKLQSQKEMIKNKKTGSFLTWYRDGSLMYVEEYEDDKLINGQYFKKNQKDTISSIINGNGIATIFDEQGALIRKIQYAKGKPLEPEN